MPNPNTHSRNRARRAVGLLAVGCLVAGFGAFAQESPLHLNPVIAKLAAGEPFIGVSTTDLSMANANELTRADLDYVYVDMEHGPLSFESLYHFTLGTLDKAAIVERGNAQADLAVFARFPPYGREQVEWIAKQALDIGLMGVIFNSIDNAEQATQAVRSMRYPQLRDSSLPEPAGLRGWSPDLASWLWGLSNSEYRAKADLWPLNPDGELLAIMMIETAEGVRNADAIASVPGVGAIFIGPADLANSLGVPGGAPEVEQALGTILEACKAHNVACGKTMTAEEMPQRIRDGWRMLNLGSASGGLTPDNAAALEATGTASEAR
ncbi:HpcH/HpaI aldolase family protein [Marinivivus vitaminiproducens]|uniref:HpcH/HpaI aldolase family protein n=1 Tax=Marinivivus vitaminiproducens TaxID=3035935 RepID=UPI0027A18F90|nr:aldolase/citrate lyase family protein [Geminicoccaceae bacterium SCSIO 64248]